MCDFIYQPGCVHIICFPWPTRLLIWSKTMRKAGCTVNISNSCTSRPDCQCLVEQTSTHNMSKNAKHINDKATFIREAIHASMRRELSGHQA